MSWHRRGVFAAALCVLLGAGASPARGAQKIVTGGADGKVKIWDTTSGEVSRTIDAGSRVHCGAVSPDGMWIAAGCADGKVRVWSAGEGKLAYTVAADEKKVNVVVFSPDGATLATGGTDGKVKLWKAADGSAVRSAGPHTGEVLALFLGPSFFISAGADGKIVIASEDGANVLPIPTEHTGGLRANVTSTTKEFTYTGGGEGKVKYFSPQGNGSFEGEQGSAVTAMSVSPDGKYLATGGADGKVKLWSTETYKLIRTIDSEHKGGVSALTITPTGWILTGGADGAGRAWDLATGESLHTVQAHPGGVGFVVFSTK